MADFNKTSNGKKVVASQKSQNEISKGTTNIEWAEKVWNPSTGCTKISSGCQHCYAATMTKRLNGMGMAKYAQGFNTVVTHENTLDIPFKFKKPSIIFVNSMSDLFHQDVPFEFIERVFDVMYQVDRHIYQVLTKRSERLVELADRLPWPDNVWMGVTVENANYVSRIDDLRDTPAAIKFLSIEPLLGPIPDLNLDGIDWVIVGGESGSGFRPMDEKWALDIRDQCLASGVAFFFKQFSGFHPKKLGRVLDGQIWDQTPLRIAEKPA
jgi:protein gp37